MSNAVVTAAAIASLGVAVSVSAQQVKGTGSIRGYVHDSLLARGPLAGATVEIVELGRSLTTPANGTFRFDSLPGGTYTMTFSHPSLTAIGFVPPGRSVQLGDGIDIGVGLTTPSGATIYGRLCPGARESETAVILGTLHAAEPATPVAGGEIRGEWTVTTVTREIGMSTTPRVVRATTDGSGRFQLCGVPNDIPVAVRAVASGIAGPPREVRLDGQLFGVRHLTIDLGDSTRHRAVVAGTVTGAGRPIPRAQITVLGTDRIARTADDGSFTISGLAAGSQMIEALAIGFERKRIAIDLAPDRPARADFDLARVAVALPEVTVTAEAGGRTGFEERRRRALGGHFITGDEIRRRNTLRVEDVFRNVPGIRIEPTGLSEYRILSGRGAGLSGNCEPAIFVDDFRIPVDPSSGVSLPVAPEEIEGIEVHQSINTAPLQYRSIGSGCGVILIWTRRGRR